METLTDPLETFRECYFTTQPVFRYSIKGTDEKFKSSEQDEQKAYQDYLKNKLQQLYNNLYKILKKIVHAITLTSYISNRNTRRKTNSS